MPLRAWIPCVLVLPALAAPHGPTAPDPVSAAPQQAETGRQHTLSVAVIGDTPYGDEQTAAFPRLVADINDAPAPDLVLHAGDVKSGSTPCAGGWLDHMRAADSSFDDPLVYVPGDNEWTDCHQPEAGRYAPLDRLAALRERLYPIAGRTLGERPMTVQSQAQDAAPRYWEYVENVRFRRASVVFATLHVVGSRNDLQPWSGLPAGDRPVQREAEFESRRAANLAWIDAAFRRATRGDAAGVLLLQHAEPVPERGYRAERRSIKQHARDFGRPVLLVHGDEHAFEAERGYAGVENLTRLETYGADVDHWIALRVDPTSNTVFRWDPRTVN